MPFRAGWRKTRRWFVHLLHLDESAHRIALGVAIGVFMGMTPTVGLQMLLVFLVTAIIPANRVAGVSMVWISNPATIVPIYSFNLLVGTTLTGGSEEMVATFEGAVASIASRDLTWWDLVSQWWDVAMEVALPLWVGSVAVGLVAGGGSYAVMYYLVKTCRRALKRRAAGKAAGAADPEVPACGQRPEAPPPEEGAQQ